MRRSRHAYNVEQKLRRRYGLTQADWDRMSDAQGGRCRICRRVSPFKLQVDHDHATGKIRGLLCGSCNKAIGLLLEDPESISRAALYVAVHQAQP